MLVVKKNVLLTSYGVINPLWEIYKIDMKDYINHGQFFLYGGGGGGELGKE